MSIFAWIIVGLIAGILGPRRVPGQGPGPGGIIGDLIAGIVGAIVGGWIFRGLHLGAVTGVNFWSIVIAFIGAIIFLSIWRAIAARGDAARRGCKASVIGIRWLSPNADELLHTTRRRRSPNSPKARWSAAARPSPATESCLPGWRSCRR